MHGSKILITGIGGFIGNHLATFINRYYPTCEILGIQRRALLGTTKQCYDFYQLDLLNKDEITEFINAHQPDYVFHLAGKVFSYDWSELYQGNVTATINLLEALKKTGALTRTVVAGSAAEYGPVAADQLPIKENCVATPKTPYGMTKLWQTSVTQYYATSHFPVMVGRLFNLIGAGTAPQLSTGDLFQQIERIIQGKQDAHISVGNLKMKRDFLNIDDACAALIAIVTKGESGGIYNVCSGASLALQDILDLSLKVTGLNVEILFDQTKLQNAYVEDIYGCNLKIKDAGWHPVATLEESIRAALNLG
jgi:GDP-4-dehydro-6-deoxy-D-mannose reductase